MLALKDKHKEVAELLIHEGADVKISNHRGQSTLSMAIQMGNKDLFHRLLDAGVDIHEATCGDKTLLHRAVEQEWVDVCEELLKHGIDVNKTDKAFGQTSLMLAGHRHNADLVRTLLRHQADPFARDFYGWSILDLETSYRPLEELLTAYRTDHVPVSKEDQKLMIEKDRAKLLVHTTSKKPATRSQRGFVHESIFLLQGAYYRLKDWEGWRILMNQMLENSKPTRKPHPYWTCDRCRREHVEGSYWGCKGCSYRLICSECYKKHQRRDCIRGCQPEHEYCEVADKAWLGFEEDIVNEAGLDFGDWVKEEQRKYCHSDDTQNSAITQPQTEALHAT